MKVGSVLLQFNTDSICLAMLWTGKVHYDRGSIPRSMVGRSGKADKTVQIRLSIFIQTVSTLRQSIDREIFLGIMGIWG